MSKLRNTICQLRGRLIPLFFLIFWFVPVIWSGLTRHRFPLCPRELQPLFSVSGMFEYGPAEWRVFYIESRLSLPQAEWSAIDEHTLFSGAPLGERSRFQRLMSMIRSQGTESDVTKLCLWISKELSSSAPDKPYAVRIRQMAIPPQLFLHHHSIMEVYRQAMASHLPSSIIYEYSPPLPTPKHQTNQG
jgi:hypothetical protein